jgi:hypothetical protein
MFTTSASELQELFGPEDLDQELIPYVNRHPRLGKIIQHPLVYSVPHFDASNKMCNRQLQAKKIACAEALRQQKWDRYIFLHERPFRLWALLKIKDQMDDTAYWQAVGAAWIDSENIHQEYPAWNALWKDDRPLKHLAMEEEERDFLVNLPESFQVFRGVKSVVGKKGLAWTLDREKAEWFATRFGGSGFVYVATVQKSQCHAYFSGRNESEIVVEPFQIKCA